MNFMNLFTFSLFSGAGVLAGSYTTTARLVSSGESVWRLALSVDGLFSGTSDDGEATGSFLVGGI
jgi:hypothetical protein